jgi:hypothetical protein
MGWAKGSLAVVAVLLVMAGSWLGWRVLDARARTPRLLAVANARVDPELASLTPARIAILLRVEDPSFETNDGTDFETPGQGLTTLTQAVAKRLYFKRFKPGIAKLELVLISRYALNARASKAEILQTALSVASFGNDGRGPVIGFAEGARRWYGRELSQLSDDQYIGLVAMLLAPNALDPVRHPAANAERSARIQRLLDGACVPTGLRDVELAGCAVDTRPTKGVRPT